MRKKGKLRGPSKEEIDRQAAEEVARLTRGAGGPGPALGGPGPGGPAPGIAYGVPGPGFAGPGSPHGGPPSPLDALAQSVQGRTRPPKSKSSPKPPAPTLGTRPPSPYDDAAPFTPGGFSGSGGAGPGPADEEFDDDVDITELALVDHASKWGTNPEDLVVRSDPFTAEQMRDQAMRQFFERQEAMKRARGAAPAPVTPLRGRTGQAESEPPTRRLSPLQAAIERKRRKQAGEPEPDVDADQAPTEQISAVGFEPAPARTFPDRDAPDDEALAELQELADLRAGRKPPASRGTTPSKATAKRAPKKSAAPAKAPAKTTSKTSKPAAKTRPQAPPKTAKARRAGAASKAPKASKVTKPAKVAKSTTATNKLATTGRTAKAGPTATTSRGGRATATAKAVKATKAPAVRKRR